MKVPSWIVLKLCVLFIAAALTASATWLLLIYTFVTDDAKHDTDATAKAWRVYLCGRNSAIVGGVAAGVATLLLLGLFVKQPKDGSSATPAASAAAPAAPASSPVSPAPAADVPPPDATLPRE